MGFDRILTAATNAERIARLRLARTPRVGPVNFAQLMLRFGTAERALKELPNLVKRTGGNIVPAPQARVDEELARADKAGARLLLLGDSDYPPLLAQVDAAPPVLWVMGPLKPVSRKAIAIVGARNASAAGQKIAETLAHDLGQAGFMVVSGLARGIDARAHGASLSTGTVAVLGGGVDDVYPPDNAELYARLAAQGLLISESPVGYTAQARDFPRRNRIISGMSLGTIVVEAELRSGSLITARLAAEQNREVFAVPGSPLDPRARGANDLLRQGANLCETVEDVLRVLESQLTFPGFDAPPATAYNPPAPLASPASDGDINRTTRALLNLVSTTPVHRDELLRLARAPAVIGLASLSELEIAGLIEGSEGGFYTRL